MATPAGDDELIPGTEVLLVREENGTFSKKNNLDILLVPQPSHDLNDPLNWSRAWKNAVLLNQVAFVFISILTPFAITPLTPILMREFDKTLPQINMLFGAAAITLGYANFAIVPCANQLGRRPTLLVCGLVCLVANAWQGAARSYGSLLAARVVGALGAAANETIMPMVVADLTFLHQRGRWLAVYFWTYFLGLFLGPVVSGAFADSGWRWFFWLCTILQAASLLASLVLMPETGCLDDFFPPPNSSATSFAALPLPPPKPAANRSSSAVLSEKNPAAGAGWVASTPSASELSSAESSAVALGPSGRAYTALGRGRPSRAAFLPVQRLQRPDDYDARMALRDLARPLRAFVHSPVIAWAALSMGFAANCLLALNLTQSQVFAAPPYLFSPAQVGYVNFAFVVGAAVGMLTAGPVGDWLALRGARRNGGVVEAEMRLVALAPYIVVCLIGMVVTAVGYQRQWPWQAIVIVGYGFVGVQVVAIPAIVISYAVDCHKHMSGNILTSATVVKNTFGFAMIFYFNDWAVKDGFIPPVLTLMALCVGFSTIGLVVFMIWGKQFRRWMSHSMWRIR